MNLDNIIIWSENDGFVKIPICVFILESDLGTMSGVINWILEQNNYKVYTTNNRLGAN